MLDSFTVGNTTFSSRLLVGTGKYASYNLMRDALVASKSDIVTVALRRAGTTQSEEDILNYILIGCIYYRIHRVLEMQTKLYVLHAWQEN